MKSNLPIDEALYEQGYNQAIKDLNDCDWKAFRREAVKDILPAMINWRRINGAGANILISKEEAVKLAIEYADELIKQLKEN